MKTIWLTLVAIALSGCGAERLNADNLALAQARSKMGPTSKWKIDPALSSEMVQKMRDNAYRFCRTKQLPLSQCEPEQDWSLFHYTRAFGLITIYQSEPSPTSPFAQAHKKNDKAFGLIRDYCERVYREQGSGDARGLGPCMAAGMGMDFFGIILVQ